MPATLPVKGSAMVRRTTVTGYDRSREMKIKKKKVPLKPENVPNSQSQRSYKCFHKGNKVRDQVVYFRIIDRIQWEGVLNSSEKGK
jgi:hypothetical protein